MISTKAHASDVFSGDAELFTLSIDIHPVDLELLTRAIVFEADPSTRGTVADEFTRDEQMWLRALAVSLVELMGAAA